MNKQRGSIRENDKKKNTYSESERDEVPGTHNFENGLGKLNSHRTYQGQRK